MNGLYRLQNVQFIHAVQKSCFSLLLPSLAGIKEKNVAIKVESDNKTENLVNY
jgi:hypothetical protein